MLIQLLRCKIHRATVTEANLDYEGSLTVDRDLVERAGLFAHEKIQVWNVSNGARFETYVLLGAAGSGVVCVNGAAARLAHKGDIVIVAAYGLVDMVEAARGVVPRVVRVDASNRPLPDTTPEQPR